MEKKYLLSDQIVLRLDLSAVVIVQLLFSFGIRRVSRRLFRGGTDLIYPDHGEPAEGGGAQGLLLWDGAVPQPQWGYWCR